MDLSNDAIFEFLDLYEKEPTIWNPKHPLNRNRTEIRNCWVRIRDSFSVSCSIKDLKKKRDSLMATFRPLAKRAKASRRDAGSGPVYIPSWFAYEKMEKFLLPAYHERPKKNNELENDMENHLRWKMMGGAIKIKNEVLPHIFKCQRPSRVKSKRNGAAKRLSHINEVENDTQNLVKYRLVGGTLKLKANICPHKFDCQKVVKSKKQQAAYEKIRQIEFDENLLTKGVPSTSSQSSSFQTFEMIECANLELNATEDPLPEDIIFTASVSDNHANVPRNKRVQDLETKCKLEVEVEDTEIATTTNDHPLPKIESTISLHPSKKQRLDNSGIVSNNVTEENYYKRPVTNKRGQDICALYTELLTIKLREFDEFRRAKIMNDIDNLIFRAKMELKEENSNNLKNPFQPVYVHSQSPNYMSSTSSSSHDDPSNSPHYS